MAITPADIQAQTFSEAKRGYDPAEVDVFLEQISSEVDAMLNKIVDLKTRLTAAEQQLADARPLRLRPLISLRPSVRSPPPSSPRSRLPTPSSMRPRRMPSASATRPMPRRARSSARRSPRSSRRSRRSTVSRLLARISRTST